MNNNATWSLVCPDSRAPLGEQEQAWVCAGCGRRYPVEAGVIRFMERDDFYEGRYGPGTQEFLPDDRTPWGRAMLYLVSTHYFWYIRKFVLQGSKILETQASLLFCRSPGHSGLPTFHHLLTHTDAPTAHTFPR